MGNNKTGNWSDILRNDGFGFGVVGRIGEVGMGRVWSEMTGKTRRFFLIDGISCTGLVSFIGTSVDSGFFEVVLCRSISLAKDRLKLLCLDFALGGVFRGVPLPMVADCWGVVVLRTSGTLRVLPVNAVIFFGIRFFKSR